jgi:small subunit ribosomal protein S17
MARKLLTGVVIRDKMEQTVIVRVMHLSKHPKYKKIVKQFNKFKAHNPDKIARTGDTVLIEETRPISKDKHFRVVKIIKKSTAPKVEVKEEAK